MNEFDLMKNGFAEKIYVSTKNGGDYVIGFFFDSLGNYTTKDNASFSVVKECKYDGTILQESFLNINDNPKVPK